MKLKYILVFTAISSLIIKSSIAHDGHNHSVKVNNPIKTIDFIENKGQWEARAKFKADLPGGVVLITDQGFHYNFTSQEDLTRIHNMTYGENGYDAKDVSNEIVNHHAYKVNFVGANTTGIEYNTFNKKSYYHNYFIGNDQSKWAGGVSLYGKVEQKNIYDGIDMVVYSENPQSFKYDFVIAPGADPSQIAISFEGVKPYLTSNGLLKIKTTVNEITENAPYTYQMIEGRKVEVASKYVLENGILSFSLPEGYNAQYPLIIDPDLVFSTFSGGTTSSSFYSQATTYDLAGHMYVGAFGGAGWPVTTGAYQTVFGGASDANINKYTPDGINLVFSTYFGGSGSDLVVTLRVNEDNELVATGSTNSANLPVTTGAYQPTNGGGLDIFVTRFSADATAILGSTYIGGSANEASTLSMGYTILAGGANTGPSVGASEIAFDPQGNIMIVSSTQSANFPVTGSPVQGTSGGGMDGVFFKLSPNCSNLIYSTFLGGSADDLLSDIKITSTGELIICGSTMSTNLNIPGGGYKTSNSGGWDGFVLKVNPTTYAYINGTFLGTTGNDQAAKIALDCGDNVYIAGRTPTTGNYPVSSNVWSMADKDVFLEKLSPDLSASLYSTRLGGDGQYLPTAFMVDICGMVYLSGLNQGTLSGMPLSDDAFQTNPTSFWFCVLEPNFNGLYFATYFGATQHMHTGNSHFDPEGIVYHSVCSSDNNFPIYPPNVWSPTRQNTGLDIVSFKFDFDAQAVTTEGESPEGGNNPNLHAVRGCKSAFLHFERASPDSTEMMVIRYEILGDAINGVDYQWIPDSIIIWPMDTIATLEIKPLLAPQATGIKRVIINTFSPCGCDGDLDNIIARDTVYIIDSLYVVMLEPTDTSCPNDEIVITAEIDSTLHYYWEPASLIPDPTGLTIKPTPNVTTTFSITVSQPGAPTTCPTRTAYYLAYVEPYPVITLPFKEKTICYDDSFELTAYVQPEGINYIYEWTPPDFIRSKSAMPNKFFAPPGQTYALELKAITPGAQCTSFDSLFIKVVQPFKFQSVTPEDTTIKYNEEVTLNSEGAAIMWYWFPVDYLDDPMLKSPKARPLKPMKYSVVGLDQYGCRDTGYVSINVVYEPKLFIPNAFSPNGDGLNDEFGVSNIQFERFLLMRIFNRHGEMVFETTNVDKRWDGTYNGQPAPQDVYYYEIRLALPNGGEQYYRKGDVTLIR